MRGRAKNPTVIFDPTYGFPTRVYWSGDYNYYEQLNISDFEVLSDHS